MDDHVCNRSSSSSSSSRTTIAYMNTATSWLASQYLRMHRQLLQRQALLSTRICAPVHLTTRLCASVYIYMQVKELARLDVGPLSLCATPLDTIVLQFGVLEDLNRLQDDDHMNYLLAVLLLLQGMPNLDQLSWSCSDICLIKLGHTEDD